MLGGLLWCCWYSSHEDIGLGWQRECTSLLGCIGQSQIAMAASRKLLMGPLTSEEGTWLLPTLSNSFGLLDLIWLFSLIDRR